MQEVGNQLHEKLEISYMRNWGRSSTLPLLQSIISRGALRSLGQRREHGAKALRREGRPALELQTQAGVAMCSWAV